MDLSTLGRTLLLFQFALREYFIKQVFHFVIVNKRL